MIWDELRNELLVTAPQDPTLRTVVETGGEIVKSIIPDKNGAFWILSQDTNKNGVVAHYVNGRTKIITAPEFHRRQLTAGTPMPPSQLLLVLRERDNNENSAALVTDDKVEPLPAPPVTYPFLIASCWGRIGYTAIPGFMSCPTRPQVIGIRLPPLLTVVSATLWGAPRSC